MSPCPGQVLYFPSHSSPQILYGCLHQLQAEALAIIDGHTVHPILGWLILAVELEAWTPLDGAWPLERSLRSGRMLPPPLLAHVTMRIHHGKAQQIVLQSVLTYDNKHHVFISYRLKIRAYSPVVLRGLLIACLARIRLQRQA